jgi:transposase-like protein
MAGMSNRRDSQDQWRRIIRDQQASGLSVAAFCRRSGVAQASLYAWKRRLRHVTDFVEVQLPAPTALDSSALELRLPGDRHVIVRPGFDRRTLLELVSALETGATGSDDEEAGA